MTVLIDLEHYRFETFQEPYTLGPQAELPTPCVRVIRKYDGRHLDLDRDSGPVFPLLWTTAHGTPEAETAEWLQDWVNTMEEFDRAENTPGFWRRAEVVPFCGAAT